MSFTKRLLINTIDIVALTIVRGLCGLMQMLPERRAYGVARLIIRLMRFAMPRMDKVARRNLELVFPGRSTEEREQILKSSYDVLARNILTFARIPLLTAERAAARIDFSAGFELMERLKSGAEGKGILLPTLHFGSFEQLVQFNALLGQPGSYLARDFELPRLDRWWNGRREMFGNKFFSRKGGYREIVRRLNAGHNVCVLYDQNVKRNHALIPFPKFFGIEVSTTRAIGIAAIRTKAPIIFAVCAEPSFGRYELIFEEIRNPWADEGTVDERIGRLMEELHRVAERAITRYPDHWFWIHRRFKTRPPGEPETLYEGC